MLSTRLSPATLEELFTPIALHIEPAMTDIYDGLLSMGRREHWCELLPDVQRNLGGLVQERLRGVEGLLDAPRSSGLDFILAGHPFDLKVRKSHKDITFTRKQNCELALVILYCPSTRNYSAHVGYPDEAGAMACSDGSYSLAKGKIKASFVLLAEGSF